jgi:RNA polymerase sigma-70 factor (ECF subfamily)
MERKNVTASTDLSRSGASEGHSALGVARTRAQRDDGPANHDAARRSDRPRNIPPQQDPSKPTAADTGELGPLDFEQVYEAHFDFVWRSLRLLGVQDEALEDAVQDTFSVVSRQLAGFEGRSALRTWLFAILQRVASNHRRRRRRKQSPLTPFAEGDAASDEPTPLAHVEAAEAARIVELFCAGLPPDRRALFVLAVFEDLPATEVAAALDLPIAKVYSRVHALREGLKRALATRGGDSD